ncbi:hypothetical protein E4U47_006980 [Claviceps purpurea]|nr:hypothetical protein E4U49_004460 [Claviceps purpurea]KAG6264246.1 hypothetical protein E4U47_006980 [Claviceps purpurea]
MEESQFELDPRGDTILILRNPKTEQLLWEPKDDGAKLKQRSNILRQKLFGSELMPDDEKTHKPAAWPFSVIKPNVPSDSEKARKENSEGNEVLFRLSSRHLALASPVFQTMLNGSWKESAPSSDQSNGSGKTWAPLQNGPDCPVRYELTATEWDTKVFLLFMNMIHCRNKLVPLSIDLTTLVKMAILVDYYQCEEATQLAAGLWIGNLSGKLPISYGRDCVAWMFVSWVFSRSDIFEKMTKLAIRGSTGGLGTIHLPFPPKLLSMANAASSLFSKANPVHSCYGTEERACCR